MDSLNFHNVKFEKSHAKLRFRRMQRITALFRLMELCIFFFMVSRFTAQIPGAFGISGEYFRGLSSLSLSTAVSPRFVFIIGNAIVIILLLKSGKLSAAATDKDNTTNLYVGEGTKLDLYEEYAKTCEKNRTLCAEMEKMDSPSDIVVKKQRNPGKSMVKLKRSPLESPMVVARVQPESLAEGGGRNLRRSLTVKYKESSLNSEEKPVYAEDHLSGKEFRQTVEAFIARQQRFLRLSCECCRISTAETNVG